MLSFYPGITNQLIAVAERREAEDLGFYWELPPDFGGGGDTSTVLGRVITAKPHLDSMSPDAASGLRVTVKLRGHLEKWETPTHSEIWTHGESYICSQAVWSQPLN